jgi:hypothetical protein
LGIARRVTDNNHIETSQTLRLLLDRLNVSFLDDGEDVIQELLAYGASPVL